MRKLTLLIAVLALGALVMQAKVTKEEKQFLKELKQNKGYKDADIKEVDDFRYILVEVEKHKYLVADMEGNLVFEAPKSLAGYARITYVPENGRGTDMYHYKNSSGFLGIKRVDSRHEAFFTGNPAVYVAETDGNSPYCDFFTLDGKKIATVTGTCDAAEQLPVMIINEEVDGVKGVATFEGDVAVEPRYDAIEPDEEGICYFVNYIDGVKYYGAVDLRKDLSDKVDCQYHSVEKTGDNWLVQKHEHYPVEVYNPDDKYEMTYLDTGEKYYAQGEYNKCRDYYTMRNTDAAWGPFYVGMCNRHDADQTLVSINEKVKKLEDASAGKGDGLIKDLKKLVDNYEQQLRNTISELDKYVKAATHTTFVETASGEADKAFEDLSDLENVNKRVKVAKEKYQKKVDNKKAKEDKKDKKEKEKKAKEKAKDKAKDKAKENAKSGDKTHSATNK